MTAPIVAAAATVPTRSPAPSLEVGIARKETAPPQALKGTAGRPEARRIAASALLAPYLTIMFTHGYYRASNRDRSRR